MATKYLNKSGGRVGRGGGQSPPGSSHRNTLLPRPFPPHVPGLQRNCLALGTRRLPTRLSDI